MAKAEKTGAGVFRERHSFAKIPGIVDVPNLIAIQTDPETGELIHRGPYCQPQNFREVENAWLGRIDKAYTAWLSHAPESLVVRDSEILSGDKRFSAASYR